MARRTCAILLMSLLTTSALSGSAAAQVIGTFRWQLAPHCNVLTLTVEQRGAGFRLDGSDDLCGASVHAAASGTAHLNPNGSVSIAVTVTRPDGIPIHHSFALTLPGLSGTWKDDVGNGGVLAFSPSVPASGSPRLVTLRGIYGVNFSAAVAAEVGLSEITYGRLLPSPPIPHLVNAPTAECPGSTDLPQAAPGHLCVYHFPTQNIGQVCISSTGGGCDTTTRLGVVLYTQSAGAGRVYHSGAWAVTLP